jgi:hypothetical protein
MRRLLVVIIVLSVLVAAGSLWLWQPRRVSGSVVDGLTGRPVPAAAVTLTGETYEAGPEGQFAPGWLWQDQWATIRAEGYLDAHAEVPRGRFPGDRVSFAVALVPNALRCVVRDGETGAALAAANVSCNGEKGTTDEYGAYTFRRVLPGTTLGASMPGYEPVEALWEGRDAQELTLQPSKAQVLVIDQYTRQPVAGAAVVSSGVAYSTGERGTAIVRRVIDGNTLQASATGYDDAVATYAAGQEIQLELRPNTLSGTVRDNDGGEPVAGALVRALVGGELVTMTQTGGDGGYTLRDLPVAITLTVTAVDHEPWAIGVERTTVLDVGLQRFEVRGIYIPLGLLTSEQRIAELLELVDKTELNAVVVDMKNDRGWLAFPSAVPQTKLSGAYQPDCMDVGHFLELCREKGIYTIARIVLFKDPMVVSAYPDWAVYRADGQLYVDTEGSTWCDPFLSEVQNYLVSLAKEVAALGFDELQFDYVRFPSDGSVGGLLYSQESTLESRTRTIREFCARLRSELSPMGVLLSADLFGLTPWVDSEKDMGIGQRVIDIAPSMDYLSPMLYPATFTTGNLGLDEPLRYPYEVVYRSCVELARKTNTRVRPWLQHYSWKGFEYGVREMQLQMQAAEDAGTFGWMFWQAGGRYLADSFDKQEGVTP